MIDFIKLVLFLCAGFVIVLLAFAVIAALVAGSMGGLLFGIVFSFLWILAIATIYTFVGR